MVVATMTGCSLHGPSTTRRLATAQPKSTSTVMWPSLERRLMSLPDRRHGRRPSVTGLGGPRGPRPWGQARSEGSMAAADYEFADGSSEGIWEA